MPAPISVRAYRATTRRLLIEALDLAVEAQTRLVEATPAGDPDRHGEIVELLHLSLELYRLAPDRQPRKDR